jgi:hypothetical protein
MISQMLCEALCSRILVGVIQLLFASDVEALVEVYILRYLSGVWPTSSSFDG